MNNKLSDVLELPIKVDVSSLRPEERGELQKELFSVGVEWDTFMSADRTKSQYLNAQSYYIYENGRITYSHSHLKKVRSTHKQISVQQLKEKIKMCKQFTKADLKDGMVVKYRGGCDLSDQYNGLALVVADSFITAVGYNYLEDFTDDLKAVDYTEFDIVEVIEVIEAHSLKNINTQWKLKSIWKREELSERDKQIISIREKMRELEKQLETLQDAKQQ